MFVLYVERVIKVNTGATEKFSPRTSNQHERTVAGPFTTLRQAQRALLAVLSTHTCVDAQIRSAKQVREDVEKGYSVLGNDRWKQAKEALTCLESIN